jgi:foldase protein PrsA
MKKIKIVFCLILCVCLCSCGLINTATIGTIDGNDVKAGVFNYFLYSVKAELLSEANVPAGEENNFWDTDLDGKKAIEVAKEKTFDVTMSFEAKYLKAVENGFGIDNEKTIEANKQYRDFVSSQGGEKAFNEFLKEIGSDEESIKEIVRKSYCISLYFTSLGTEEGSLFYIPEATIEERAQEIYNEGNLVTQAKAKHILISTVDDMQNPLSKEEQDQKKKLAEEIYNKIINGEDFDTLMHQYSEDPGLQSNPDGYTFGPGEMVPEFEQGAFALEKGQVSKPILSQFGYHIIKLEDKVFLSFEDIKEEVAGALITEREIELAEEWKKDYKITKNEDQYKKIK